LNLQENLFCHNLPRIYFIENEEDSSCVVMCDIPDRIIRCYRAKQAKKDKSRPNSSVGEIDE
jgi:hypothetical protein